MEKITTQSAFVSDKKDLLIYRGAEDTIFIESKKNKHLIQKFQAFCERQQENRLGWTAFSMAVQVCLLVPITLSAVYFNGNRFILWVPVILSSFVTEFSNLASLPTKISIPIFFISLLINLSVIMLSFIL